MTRCSRVNRKIKIKKRQFVSALIFFTILRKVQTNLLYLTRGDIFLGEVHRGLIPQGNKNYRKFLDSILHSADA